MKRCLCCVFWAAATFFLISSCGGSSDVQRSCSRLRIGSFNIQVFGIKKLGRVEVTDILTKIVQRYDLLLIQEIRDKSGQVLKSFAKRVNSTSLPFGWIESQRLGRTNYKEQYAYFYRRDKLDPMDAFVYSGAEANAFERPPLVAQFKAAGRYSGCFPPFAVLGLHAQPRGVVNELSALSTVYDRVSSSFSNKNAIIMGDFNGDCKYFPKGNRSRVALYTQTRFLWLISGDVDTTVGKTNCAYDRIVLAGGQLQNSVVPNSAGVFRFDKAYGLTEDLTKKVSDHYPVEFLLAPAQRSSRRRQSFLPAAGLRRAMALAYAKRFAQLFTSRAYFN